jgi:hypothetical protein
MVQEAQVHPLGVQIHAAIVSVLDVIESHHGPPGFRSFRSRAPKFPADMDARSWAFSGDFYDAGSTWSIRRIP